jgi:hypothetical protein
MAHVYGHSYTFTPPLAFHCPIRSLFANPLYVTHFLLTWKTSFLHRGANTHPLLFLVCYQLFNLRHFSHPNRPHRSSYNIYIDDINNISHPI